MAVKFGPGGNSLSFGKRKFPDELPSYLASMGLDCYEKLPALASGNNITVTLHAPYFISLSSVEAEKRDNSVNYIAESLRAADKLGATKVVVHSRLVRKDYESRGTVSCEADACKGGGFKTERGLEGDYMPGNYGQDKSARNA